MRPTFKTAHIKKESEIPTASLADIVFLLLIFFLVTTSIDSEKGISMVLPANNEVKPVFNDKLVKILIDSQGRVAFNDELCSLNSMQGKIRERLAVYPDLVASIKTHKNTDYRHYIKVLDKVKQAWGKKAARISISD